MSRTKGTEEFPKKLSDSSLITFENEWGLAKQDKEMKKILSALSNPLNMQVFHSILLLDKEEFTARDIIEKCKLGDNIVVKHLSQLENKNLITKWRNIGGDGRSFKFCIDYDNGLAMTISKACFYGQTSCLTEIQDLYRIKAIRDFITRPIIEVWPNGKEINLLEFAKPSAPSNIMRWHSRKSYYQRKTAARYLHYYLRLPVRFAMYTAIRAGRGVQFRWENRTICLTVNSFQDSNMQVIFDKWYQECPRISREDGTKICTIGIIFVKQFFETLSSNAKMQKAMRERISSGGTGNLGINVIDPVGEFREVLQ